MIPNTNYHNHSLSRSKIIRENNKIIRVQNKQLRKKYKEFDNIQRVEKDSGYSLKERYRIPPKLIEELFILTI